MDLILLLQSFFFFDQPLLVTLIFTISLGISFQFSMEFI